jgi:NADH-quinone oxidoreductase subunit N
MKPLIATAVFAILMMFAALYAKEKRSLSNFAAILMLGLVGLNVWELVDYANLMQASEADPLLFNKMLRVDNYALWFNVLMTSASLVYVVLFRTSIEAVGRHVGEYYALHFFILCGIFLVSSYNNLLILFLGIEIMSIPQYVLAGADKRNMKSSEASLKYFLMGAFSTGFLLMGIVLLYGAMGTFEMGNFNFYKTGSLSIMGVLGVLFMLVAVGFKVSAAPMHFWTPDVYDGAPTPFTAFMASIVKVSIFLGMMRLFMEGFSSMDVYWRVMVIGVLTVLTLIIGNITAVYQQSVKRMLAYSSIAQAGFMLFVVIGGDVLAMKGMVLYAVAYTLATLGIFSVLVKLKDYTYDGFNGLAKKNPFMAFVAAISLMSLAGIPLTAGFFAKWYVLASAIKLDGAFWLVVFALVMAAVSVYYYFKVIIAMYFKTGDPEFVSEVTVVEKVFMAIVVTGIVLWGIMPEMLLSWI